MNKELLDRCPMDCRTVRPKLEFKRFFMDFLQNCEALLFGPISFTLSHFGISAYALHKSYHQYVE